MSLSINTNVHSLFAQRSLSTSQSSLGTSLERLSTGLRINSAKDDAAGLFISQKQTSDIRGIDQSIRNAGDGISLAQTGEGALAQVSNSIQRIREIAVQSSNATLEDRTGLQKEVDQLTQEISRIVQTTTFNGNSLFDVAGTSSLTFQVGQDGNANNQVSLTLSGLTGGLISAYASSLTATGTVDVSSAAAASATLSTLETDLDDISKQRATFGAVQNRFESVISNLSNYSENLQASRSRIQDTDFAAETANLTKAQILQQAGTSILAQANTLPQNALSLLR
ncbi:MAG: flagellin FliC [Methylococcales bacterium]|jgi:flagellin|nr:flagellin FliC [Methylococcales bacterium]MBT7410693.1 flagellin FliC [Methylococcales bacterium]